MTGPRSDGDDAAAEVDYYRRQVDEVAAENIRLSISVSALQHEVRQKRQGFALLSTLQRSISGLRDPSAVFEWTIAAINPTLGMDRTVVLVPTGEVDRYRPAHWIGYRAPQTARLGSLSFEFPRDFAAGTGVHLVNKATASSPLIERIRDELLLPYFVCVPVLAYGTPIGLILSGRLKEAGPILAPLDQGDVDTFRAIAGLISASVELERIGRLRGFLPPQLAELILRSGNESVLEHHRREIATVFADLRGFTAFSESFEPEVVMGVLQEYHEVMGRLIVEHGGTIEHVAGDGLMVFFNDPVPCIDPAHQAVRMAVAMRDEIGRMDRAWQMHEYGLGFGVGISLGYATLGLVGFEGRMHYAAIGSVVNLAARLSDEARPGQILVTSRVQTAVHDLAEMELTGPLSLKGFHRPVAAFNVVGLRPVVAAEATRAGSTNAP